MYEICIARAALQFKYSVSRRVEQRCTCIVAVDCEGTAFRTDFRVNEVVNSVAVFIYRQAACGRKVRAACAVKCQRKFLVFVNSADFGELTFRCFRKNYTGFNLGSTAVRRRNKTVSIGECHRAFVKRRIAVNRSADCNCRGGKECCTVQRVRNRRVSACAVTRINRCRKVKSERHAR